MTDTVSTATPTKVKKSGSGLAFLALLMSLGALGSSGYLYYTDMMYKQSNINAISRISAAYKAQDVANSQAIQNLQKNIDQLNSKVSDLAPTKGGNVLFQVNELISLANQGLVVYNDIPSTLRLLDYAKQMLDANNDAMYTGLKYALATDVARLTQLPTIDKVMLSGQLDGLASQISNLKIEKVTSSQIVASNNTEQSSWSKFIANIKSSLSGLVTISKSSDADGVVLLPQQHSLAQESIRVDFLSARMALLQHDQASWNYSLSNAKTAVNIYFSGYQGIDKIQAQLAELLNVNVSNPQANIDATLTQLIKINNLK